MKVSKAKKASYFLGDLFDVLVQPNVDNDYEHFSSGVKKRKCAFQAVNERVVDLNILGFIDVNNIGGR